MAKIQDYITNKHKYEIDSTYQRPSGAWSTSDNQCLIDTIIKGEPVPMFFLNHKSGEDVFYVVDGQQRLDAIRLFYDNELRLNGKFSGEENHRKTFNGDNPISDEQREAFLNYNLNFYILEDYNDEKIRMIFSRLQRGKPLTLGERLNAKPGTIVVAMREIAEHPFMDKSVAVPNERYGTFPDAARILFYEKYGCKDSGTPAIISFFEEHQNLSKNSAEYNKAISILNFLAKCFPPKPGNYQYLKKHAWVFAVYTMIRELNIGYALKDNEQSIKNFVSDFHNKIYNEDSRRSNQNYQRFYDNVRGGWSEKIITLRKKILISEFLKKYNISEKDEKRQITDEEKISAFAKHSKCQKCGKQFKDYKKPEYHHREMHVLGGKSEINNIMVLCGECHNKIHGSEKIELPNDEELLEDDNNQ